MNERGAPIRWWLPIVAIATAWALAFLTSCIASQQIPRVTRADTRRIGVIQIEGDVMQGLINGYRLAYPNEAAFCLRGELADTLVEGDKWIIAKINSFLPAFADSADPQHVYFPRHLPGGCSGPRTIGLSHDHNVLGPCTHSHEDTDVLFQHQEALLSIVFCADGRMEILYQDGRRAMDSWLP